MSDTATNETTPNLLLDGDLPRLGSAHPIVPIPAAPVPDGSQSGVPTLPVVSPVLTTQATAPGMGGLASLPVQPSQMSADVAPPTLPTLPTLPAPAMASTPSVSAPVPAPSVGTTPGSQPTGGDTPRHPMAHLMPEKTAPSEASRRAAEQRAAKKAKAKKIKLGAAAGMLVLAAVIGPPLGKWVSNALNEAGSTTEEPAPAPAPTTAPAGAIDAAKQVVDDATQQANPTP
jgi:hypothetical protein